MSDESGKAAKPADPFSQARHDLRTPVNQILGYSELLQEIADEEGREDLAADLKKIQQAARRQLELIDKYLAPGAASPAPAPAAPPSVEDEAPAGAFSSSSEVSSGGLDLVRLTPSTVGKGGPLLVVDDNEMNRDMLSRRLTSRGFEVEVAEDGAQALEKIAARRFDLVLLDVMMPGISGLEVLETLRKTYAMTDLPVIMATAMDQSKDIVEALKLGANDYVTKPLDFPVVLARVQTQLVVKRQKDEIQRLVENLEVRNRFIRSIFGRYLSDEVVESLLASPEGLKLGGEKKTVTIMMSDLRAFTSVSERLGPEQVVRMLNLYLGAMTEIIMRRQGTIDEFIGDAILTIFGAPFSRPDDAQRAVACAVEMQLAMAEVNAQNESEGLPRIEMGIAVHTGEVVVGNIGSQRRTKYGIVGPPVNLAGRIESYTVGGQILISEATLRETGDVVQVGERLSVKAKGAREPVTVHDLRGIGGPYGLFLPERHDHLQALLSPPPLRYWILEGKQVGDESFEARLSKLSESGAELLSETSLPPLSNLKLELRAEDGSMVAGDLYGKVTEVRGEDGRVLVVRFTTVSPEIESHLSTLSRRAS
jgi:adenylate cyclase